MGDPFTMKKIEKSSESFAFTNWQRNTAIHKLYFEMFSCLLQTNIVNVTEI